jgi:aconitate hydratase
VVGTFVEFFGPGVAAVPVANRATIGNMSPEYGCTSAIFPVDEVTLAYLRLTGRPEAQVALVEAYAKEQGLWHDPDHEPGYSQVLGLDLSAVVPSIAGPKRPQDRIPLAWAPQAFRAVLGQYAPAGPPAISGPQARPPMFAVVATIPARRVATPPGPGRPLLRQRRRRGRGAAPRAGRTSRTRAPRAGGSPRPLPRRPRRPRVIVSDDRCSCCS